MAPSEGRSLAQGAVVETRLCARLFGVKLLVIDGAVTLVPRLDNGPFVVIPSDGTGTTELSRALGPARSDGPVNGARQFTHSAALGAGLHESARRLEANAHRLRDLDAT